MDEPLGTESLRPKYKRVVLKLSGEGFGHRGKSGIIHVVEVTDRRLARIVQRCQELPGDGA